MILHPPSAGGEAGVVGEGFLGIVAEVALPSLLLTNLCCPSNQDRAQANCCVHSHFFVELAPLFRRQGCRTPSIPRSLALSSIMLRFLRRPLNRPQDSQ